MQPRSHAAETNSASASRLLLDNAHTLTLKAIAGDGSIQTLTKEIAGSEATMELSLPIGQTYAIDLIAADVNGTAVYAATSTVTLDGDSSLELYLLPVPASGTWPTISAESPSLVLADLAAKTDTAWLVDMGSNSKVELPDLGPLGLDMYFQKLDGQPLVDASGASLVAANGSYTITSSLLGTQTSFWISIYNPGAEPLSTNKSCSFGSVSSGPDSLSATGGAGQITVSWPDVSGATSYRLYWGSSAGVKPASASLSDDVSSPLVISSLAAGTSRYFVIRAVMPDGESSSSPEAHAITSPDSLTAAGGVGKITVSWPAVSGALSYKLYWAASPGVDPASATAIANATSPYVMPGLAKGTGRSFVVTAQMADGESALSPESTASATGLSASWVQSVNASSSNTWQSLFAAVASDGAGAIYAAGIVRKGSVSLTNYVFGQGLTQSVSPSSYNANWWDGQSAVFVKYNSLGQASAASIVTNSTLSDNSGIAALAWSPGNSAIYAAGYANGGATYYFPGPAAANFTGGFGAGPNIMIARYDSSGSVLWAQTASPSSYSNLYNGVAADPAGNAYAGGRFARNGGGSYGFGNSVTMSAGNASLNIWAVVKYDQNGLAQWYKSTPGALGSTEVNGMGSDSSGKIIAVGDVAGMTTYDFGSGTGDAGLPMNRTGSGNAVPNAAIATYRSDGKTLAAAVRDVGLNGACSFMAACADAAGNIYAVGYVTGNNAFGFGSASATPTNASATSSTEHNAVIAKFDPNLTPLWVRTVNAPTANTSNDSIFTSVACNPDGYIFAGGHVTGNGSFQFGSETIHPGAAAVANPVLVVYNSDGSVFDARTTGSGSVPDGEWSALAWDSASSSLALSGRINNVTSAFFDSLQVFGQDSQDSGASYHNALIGLYK